MLPCCTCYQIFNKHATNLSCLCIRCNLVKNHIIPFFVCISCFVFPGIPSGFPVENLVFSGYIKLKGFSITIWVFPRIMVSQDGWFIRENPMNKWMIWVVFPLFLVQHPYRIARKQLQNHKHKKFEVSDKIAGELNNKNSMTGEAPLRKSHGAMWGFSKKNERGPIKKYIYIYIIYLYIYYTYIYNICIYV